MTRSTRYGLLCVLARRPLRPPVSPAPARPQLGHFRRLPVHGSLVSQQHPVLRQAMAHVHAGQASPQHLLRSQSEFDNYY